jgi:hypothetical protein
MNARCTVGSRARALLFVFAMLMMVLLHHGSAQAQWQSGYEARGFVGGGALCAVEFEGRVAIGGGFEAAGCARSPGVVFTDFDGYEPAGAGLWYEGSYSDNARVTALAVYEGQLIAAGRFAGRGQSPPIANVAAWNGSSWSALGQLSGAQGSGTLVFDLVVFEGDLVAVGRFTYGGGASFQGVARFDGERWLPMGVRPPGAEALAVYNGELYCGLAKWDGVQWQSLGTLEPASARITALDVVAYGLAIGGTFMSIDGESMVGAALLDPNGIRQFGSGARITYDPGFDECPCTEGVAGFASFGDRVYMLASVYWGYDWYGLTELRTLPNGTRYWAPVDGIHVGRFGVFPEHQLLSEGALEIVDGRLLVLTGSEHRVELPDAGGLDAAALSEGIWSPLTTQRGWPQPPEDMVADAQGTLWMLDPTFGLFMESARGYRRAIFGAGPDLSRVASGGDRVFASGSWVQTGHVYQRSAMLLEYDADGQLLDGCSSPWGIESLPYLYENAIAHVIRWGDSNLAELQSEEGWSSPLITTGLGHFDASCQFTIGIPLDAPVDAMVLHQDTPWIVVENELLRASGAPGEELTLHLVATFNAPVRAMASDGSRLVLGGEFSSVNGLPIAHLAAFDGEAWWAPATVDGPVLALASDGNGMIAVGGQFEHFGGKASRNLALLYGSTIGFFPDGPHGPEGWVDNVSLTAGGLIASGSFVEAGGQCSMNVAEWMGDLRTVAVADPQAPPTTYALPTRLRLLDPAPNPFNPRVTLAFELPRPAHAVMRIYDAAGRCVRELASRDYDAGTHAVVWDGTDDRGAGVASGVYLGMITSEGRSDRQKLTLVR